MFIIYFWIHRALYFSSEFNIVGKPISGGPIIHKLYKGYIQV